MLKVGDVRVGETQLAAAMESPGLLKLITPQLRMAPETTAFLEEATVLKDKRDDDSMLLVGIEDKAEKSMLVMKL